MECKYAPLDLKRVDAEGAFEGYASLFNSKDLGSDVVAPGAFRKSLDARGVRGIKMLFQHDPNEVIGVWASIFEDSKGLYVKGRLNTEVARAREVLALMREGALDGLSIGFRAVDARRDARTGIRRLLRVDLWEISVVTFPMLPQARVRQVKGRPFVRKAPTEREFERWLTRDAGLTRKEARAVLRSGFNGLLSLRDAGGGECEADRFARRLREAAVFVRQS